MVTHIKKTMSEADNLYGVTMAEPGVSTLVSVQLSEAAKFDNSDKNKRQKEETVTAEV